MIPDRDQFEIIQSVPVVDTFDGRGVNVDDDFLDDLIADANKRQQETGDMAPLIVGHNPDGEGPQAPVIGFVRNLRKQKLGNTDRNAAFADLWVYKEHKEKLREFPRRSAEIVPSLRRLDALAVLGSTAPERDLGLTTLKLQREIKVDEEKDKKPDPMAQIMDMLTQILEKLSGDKPEAPEDDKELESILAELEQGGAPQEKEEVKEDVKLHRRLAEMEAKVARSEIKDELLKLQRSGIMVNVDDETEVLVKLDPDTRKLMLARIEKNYPKAPTTEKPLPGLDESSATTETKKLTPPQREKIMALSRTQGKPYEVAFAEVMGTSLNTFYGSR